MAKIDRRSLGCLEPYIKRLQSRLSTRITPNLCWDRFMDETGSELVHRSTRMFVDGTSLGGSPEKVGHIASDYAMSIALLRAKRNVTATPFAYLTIPPHGAMSALLVFVLEIMIAFNTKLSLATTELSEQAGSAALHVPNLAVFQPKDMSQTTLIIIGAVAVLTIANTMAPQIRDGRALTEAALLWEHHVYPVGSKPVFDSPGSRKPAGLTEMASIEDPKP